MKITKLIHSCLLVEMPDPVNRTALFDPGIMSEAAVQVDTLQYLDDIIITHNHADHMSVPLIKKLKDKFPEVRITATAEAARDLLEEGIEALTEETPGIVFFKSPHEDVSPLAEQPEQNGINYLNLLTHPGDSHSFGSTLPVLALPVTAPWGSTIRAVNLAISLGPKYIIPIHDWHWSEEARKQTYDRLSKFFKNNGIEFLQPETGVPIVLDVKPQT